MKPLRLPTLMHYLPVLSALSVLSTLLLVTQAATAARLVRDTATSENQLAALFFDQPLSRGWHVGLAGSLNSTFGYPGSDTRETDPVVLPTVYYQGRDFTLNPFGINYLGLFGVDWHLKDETPDTGIREGMDGRPAGIGLSALLPVGLYANRRQSLYLLLPVGNDFSLDGENFLHYQGSYARPTLAHAYRYRNWQFLTEYSAIFQDARLQQFTYGVPTQSVRADRPFYEARGGYAGSQVSFTLEERIRQYSAGVRLSLDLLQGAVNVDSPLVKDETQVSAALYFEWIY